MHLLFLWCHGFIVCVISVPKAVCACQLFDSCLRYRSLFSCSVATNDCNNEANQGHTQQRLPVKTLAPPEVFQSYTYKHTHTHTHARARAHILTSGSFCHIPVQVVNHKCCIIPLQCHINLTWSTLGTSCLLNCGHLTVSPSSEDTVEDVFVCQELGCGA